MSAEACLPFEGVTRCGYCNRRLVLQPAGDWACPRCSPLLRSMKASSYESALAQFGAFVKAASKAWSAA